MCRNNKEIICFHPQEDCKQEKPTRMTSVGVYCVQVNSAQSQYYVNLWSDLHRHVCFMSSVLSGALQQSSTGDVPAWASCYCSSRRRGQNFLWGVWFR